MLVYVDVEVTVGKRIAVEVSGSSSYRHWEAKDAAVKFVTDMLNRGSVSLDDDIDYSSHEIARAVINANPEACSGFQPKEIFTINVGEESK